MKRVITGILVLLAAWRLLEIPSINGAFFAFLTLGINPLTNQPFSTLSLIALLLMLIVVVLLLFFSQAMKDLFGGISDWLTQAERDYKAMPDDAGITNTLNLASLPAQAVLDEPDLISVSASVASSGSAAIAHHVQLPSLNFEPLQAYLARLGQRYSHFVARVQSHLRSLSPRSDSRSVSAPKNVIHNIAFNPELVEVVAIFEQMALEAEEAAPKEAVIVVEKQPNPVALAVRKQIIAIQQLVTAVRSTILKDAVRTSTWVGSIVKTAAGQLAAACRGVATSTAHVTTAVLRTIYRGILLAVLGCLLSAGWVAHILALTARRIRKTAVLCAVTVTLSMFAVGRGLIAAMHGLQHGAAAVCHGIYWLLSNAAMLVFLAAGYLLFAFALLCFMAWEICEPYARKVDHWLGHNLDTNQELSEAANIGREMSRTFTQWYHELRNIKRSIYH